MLARVFRPPPSIGDGKDKTLRDKEGNEDGWGKRGAHTNVRGDEAQERVRVIGHLAARLYDLRYCPRQYPICACRWLRGEEVLTSKSSTTRGAMLSSAMVLRDGAMRKKR